jgi:hypothetical protein
MSTKSQAVMVSERVDTLLICHCLRCGRIYAEAPRGLVTLSHRVREWLKRVIITYSDADCTFF